MKLAKFHTVLLETHFGLVLFYLVTFLLFHSYCSFKWEVFCLQINDDEVELWVVKAITAKLIDCKMDQMNQVVVVR